MPTVTGSHRAAERHEYHAAPSDSEEEQLLRGDESRQQHQHPGALDVAESAVDPRVRPDNGRARSKDRGGRRQFSSAERRALEKGDPPSYPTSEVRYTAVRATTVLAGDDDGNSARYLRRRAPRERPVWYYMIPLALLGTGAFLVLNRSRSAPGFGDSMLALYGQGMEEKPELKYFDMLRSAGIAPRFVHLEKPRGDEGWLLQMDIPGFLRNELNIYSLGQVLTVRGTHTCPTARGLSQEPMCIERHVSEEVRFPDEADMTTAEATLANGVLKVSVKPVEKGHRARGRVIEIMDVISNRVHEFGEAIKEKIGLYTATQHEVAGQWKLTGHETEEYIRQLVERYVDSLRHVLGIPAQKERELLELVRPATNILVRQFRKGAASADQLRRRVRHAVEQAWEMLKEESQELEEQGGRGASQVSDTVAQVVGAAERKVSEARDMVADEAAKLKEAAERIAVKVKSEAQEGLEAAKEIAESAVDEALYSAEHAMHRVEEAGKYAGHRAAEQLESVWDAAHESGHRVAHAAGEAMEKLGDRVKESAHRMEHRVSESAEHAQNRAREEADHARHRAEEAAEKASHRAEEAASHPKAAGHQTVFEAGSQAKGVFESIKAKLFGIAV